MWPFEIGLLIQQEAVHMSSSLVFTEYYTMDVPKLNHFSLKDILFALILGQKVRPLTFNIITDVKIYTHHFILCSL